VKFFRFPVDPIWYVACNMTMQANLIKSDTYVEKSRSENFEVCDNVDWSYGLWNDYIVPEPGRPHSVCNYVFLH
jgi:hypothetical protein